MPVGSRKDSMEAKGSAVNGNRRYLILIAASICAGLTGVTYVWSIFTSPLIQAHGWLSSEVSLAYSLYFVMQFFMGFVGGGLQRRFGTRRLAVIGGVMYSLAWICMGHADTLPMLYFSFSFLGGGGAGLVYNSSVAVATKWFPDKKGFANGLCIGVTGLTPLAFAPLGNYLVEAFDLGTSLTIIGVIPLVFYLVFTWFIIAPADDWQPEGMGPAQPEGGDSGAAARNFTTGEMVRTPLFWAMLAAFAFSASSGSMVTSHGASIGAEFVGLTSAQAALQVGILAVGNFCGRFGFGALSDRVGRANTLLITLGITLADMLVLFPLASDFFTFAVAMVLAGACYGASLTVIPSLCGDAFGTRYFGQNYGLLFSGLSIASILGPMVGAWAKDATGSFMPAVHAAAIFAVAGIVSVLILKALEKRVRRRNA